MLDENSQLLCSWSIHIGSFKVKRLSFGMNQCVTADAIFQKTMQNLFRGISNVVVYQDDISATGKNLKQHLNTLKEVLHKLKTAGLRLNYNICKLFQPKI